MERRTPSSLFRLDTGQVVKGTRRVVVGGVPAVGVSPSLTVPGGVRWRIMTARVALTTSANVGPRQPFIQYATPDVVLFAETLGAAWQANNSANLSFGLRVPTVALTTNGADANGPLLDLWLLDGWVFTVVISNAQPGDQATAITAYVEETYDTDSELADEWQARRHAQPRV